MKKELNTQKFESRFLNNSFLEFLYDKNICIKLLLALKENEIDKLIEKNIYFDKTYSPPSITEPVDVPKHNFLDLVTSTNNYFDIFSSYEIVACFFLHEIGHIFFGYDNEHFADNFVVSRGYGAYIVSGLEKGLKEGLIGFNKEAVEKRIISLQKK